MPNIYDVAQSFRKQLVRRERNAAVRLVEAYGTAYERLSAQLDKLLKKMDEARDRGEIVDQAWLLREQRYFTLLNQVLQQIGKFADLAGGIITDQQKQAVNQAMQDSQRLLLNQMEESPEGISGEFNRLNKSATENLVGFLSNGSPLNSLLGRLAPEARGIVERGLINGVIQGRGPRAIAREIREGLNSNLTRALRIARTETIRSYREASHRTYQENSDILEGWYWLSALNSRTCRACIALHGTFHTLDERLKGHVQCRCTQVPGVKGVDPGIEKGTDWFKKQPASVQKEILDAEGEYEAYKSGRVKLEDFVGLRRSLQWGDSYQALSLKRALAGEGRFPVERVKPEPIIPPAPKPRLIRKPVPPPELKPIEQPKPELLPDTGPNARKRLNDFEKQIESESAALKKEREAAAEQWVRARGKQRKHFEAQILSLDLAIEFKKSRAIPRYKEVLYQSEPAEFNVVATGFDPYSSKKLNEGIDAFKRLVGKGKLEGLTVTADFSKARAFYNNNGGISTSGTPRTVVHELGHWLEDLSPEIHRKILDFYARRTVGDNLERLKDVVQGSNYDDKEVTKKDKFFSPYVGKYYAAGGNQYATEILSMGLEEFFADPLTLSRRDPDFFDFIYEVIR